MTTADPPPFPPPVGTAVSDLHGVAVGRVRGIPVSTDDVTTIAVELTDTGAIVSVPYSGATASSTSCDIVLPLTRQQLHAAPPLCPAVPADVADDTTNHPHVGAPDCAIPDLGTPQRVDATDNLAVTRSEEQLRITTERYPCEQVRIRKRIVAEERTITVLLRREELVVDRVNLAHHAEGDVASSVPPHRGIEMVLHTEEPVVQVKAVPVERIRVHVHNVKTYRTVDVALNHEEVGVDIHPDDEPLA